MRGPVPRPLELVKAEGNPNHEKVDIDTPKFVPIAPECPEYLDEVAKKEWERLAPELGRLGLLTSGDMAAFACYCVSYSLFVAAKEAMKDGALVMETGNGYRQERPEISIMNKAMKSIKDFAIQFGFTPSARGRIELPDHGDVANEDLD